MIGKKRQNSVLVSVAFMPRYIISIWMLSSNLPKQQCQVMAQYMTQYMAQYMAQDTAPDMAQDMTQYMAKDTAQDTAQQ